MSKKPRLIKECGTYHLTFRGNNKRRLFRWQREYKHFIELLRKYKLKQEFLLHHYVLMMNHIHLCLTSTRKTNISKLMQGLQLSYFRYHNKRTSYVGHLFQGRFFSKIVDDERYLITSSLYIERNPVIAGLVKHPEDYPWSSYRHYALGETDSLVDSNPLYSDLAGTDEERQKCYREIMSQSIIAAGEKTKVLTCN